jgi:uncharacterized protein involved in exopolysaccharide biosynthesis
MTDFRDPDTPPAEVYRGTAREETSLFGFVNVLLKYRAMISLFMLSFGAVGTVNFLTALPRYTTRLGINVETRQGRPTGFAGQLGAIAGYNGEASGEVAFLSELLHSPPLLRETAKGPYQVLTAKGRISGSLAKFYGFEGAPELHQEELIRLLTDNITFASSARTGNIWIFVDAPYPELSQQIARKLIEQLDAYSRNRRHAQAAAESDFMQQRLAEARSDLRAAEERAVDFRLSNRDFASPELAMANSRLLRDVNMQQQLYTSLLQAYDNARIAEANDLPTITILEPPELPLKPERSGAASAPLLGAITGLLIAIVLAFIRERMAETSSAPTAAFSYYAELKQQALDDLRNPLRPLGRALKPH